MRKIPPTCHLEPNAASDNPRLKLSASRHADSTSANSASARQAQLARASQAGPMTVITARDFGTIPICDHPSKESLIGRAGTLPPKIAIGQPGRGSGSPRMLLNFR